MFEFLKKKLTGLADKLKEKLEGQKREEKAEAEISAAEEPISKAPKIQEVKETVEAAAQKTEKTLTQEVAKKEKKAKPDKKKKTQSTKTKPVQIESKDEFTEEENLIGKPQIEAGKTETAQEVAVEAEKEKEVIDLEQAPQEEIGEAEKKLEEEILEKVEPQAKQEEKKKSFFEMLNPFAKPKEKAKIRTIQKTRTPAEEPERELEAKTGFAEKLKGIVTGKIKIQEKETESFFEELELSLLESDVEIETAKAITQQLKKQLVGREISSSENVTGFLKTEIRKALKTIMETEKIEVLELAQKPLKILFLGPNGAGKTTTIAKIANYFAENGKQVVLAAGDTFRAASIEQLEAHASKLGVKVVKHKYGSDPAAVAFDAVKAAEAKKLDAVLIDTAGRQDTNKNLIEELKKIVRVVKPDLKIYVGEAYTGQALLAQATEFNNAIGIDAFVLTKIDSDTKGGTAISLLYTFKKPILFVGTGQKYSDLKKFTSEFIIERVI